MSTAKALKQFEPRVVELASTRPLVYCDVGDLLFYMKHHKNVSGIQRVISSVASSVFAAKHGHSDIRWCMVDPITTDLREINASLLQELLAALDDPALTREKLDDRVKAIESVLAPCKPAAGDIFLILGAFWVFDHASSILLRMRRSGVRTAALIYDLIPIQHPEYCEKSLTAVFTRQMRGIIPFLDCVVTISDFVCEQFGTYMRSIGTEPIAARAVPLGCEPPRAVSAKHAFCEGEYVLIVGTIEIRKNHTYLLNIWRHMLAKRPRNTVPKLVIVGRKGWRVEDLMAQLDATDYLNGHIIVLQDIADEQLEGLYERCLFTAFPSFTEGWGLPVGESLSRGKLCVASRAASIPEIGGEFPIYVDPYNTTEGLSIIERLIDDRDYLDERTRAIASGFVARPWSEFTNELFATIKELVGERPPKVVQAVAFPQATWLQIGAESAADGCSGNLACIEGWFPVESFGRWMSAPDACLELSAAPNTSYRIIIDISVPPWLTNHGLRLHGDGVREQIIKFVPPQGGKASTTVTSDRDGNVTVRLRTLGDPIQVESDARLLYLGVRGFMFYDIEDQLNYMRGIEQITLMSLSLLA